MLLAYALSPATSATSPTVGSGKTTAINVASHVRTQQLARGGTSPRRVELHVIHPRAHTLPALFGKANPDTLDWVDGHLTAIFRQYHANLAVHKGTTNTGREVSHVEGAGLRTTETILSFDH